MKPITAPSDLDRAIRGGLAVHEALRRLGFPAEELDPVWNKHMMKVHLAHEGKTFVIDVENAPMTMTYEEFKSAWEASRRAWNEVFTKDQCREVYLSVFDEAKLLELTMALTAKGIEPPAIVQMRTQRRAQASTRRN